MCWVSRSARAGRCVGYGSLSAPHRYSGWSRARPRLPAALIGHRVTTRSGGVVGGVHSHQVVVLAAAVDLRQTPVGAATDLYAGHGEPVLRAIPRVADPFHRSPGSGPASSVLQLLFADNDQPPLIPFLEILCLYPPLAWACWLGWRAGWQTTSTRRLK